MFEQDVGPRLSNNTIDFFNGLNISVFQVLRGNELMAEQVGAQKPWYRHGMVWLVVGIPLSSVIAGIYFIIIASSGANDVVVDNYYKDGLAINQSFAQDNKAKTLHISAYLSMNDKQQLVAIVANTQVPFIEVRLSHHKDKDFDIQGAMVLSEKKSDGGVYRLQLQQPLQGLWFVQLTAHQTLRDTPWRLQAKLNFPLSQPVYIEPVEH